MKSYMVSLLKAWWGPAATRENDFAFDYLPRIDGDHSHYQMALRMVDGTTKGFIVLGQNPAVGSANAPLQRKGLANLDWLVVRDTNQIETAAFWYDSPEIETGERRPQDIGTEVFFLPAATHTEKDGMFTNTQRLLQWHAKAVEPPGDCRSELWFTYHLARRVRERLAGSADPKDRPVLELTWDYPLQGPHAEPEADAIVQEINGRHADGRFVAKYQELADDGSTSCGSWIHAGIYADGVNHAARRKPHTEQNWIAPEWGWAWPGDRRMLYNRASADPDGRPWSERKRYVWWDEQQGKWTGYDIPDFVADKRPDYRAPKKDARGMDAISGDQPFIMMGDGVAWLYSPSGLLDGPLPTYYEPLESPVDNLLYPERRSNPVAIRWVRPENPYNPPGDARYPHVVTTFRLTEHHTAGAMSRYLPWLAELQPEMFAEIDPVLAAGHGLQDGDWMTIVTERAEIEARAHVTARMRPLEVAGRRIHQVALPWHWSYDGLSTGDAANDLIALSGDPNVTIQDSKSFSCDVRAGRRRRSPTERLAGRRDTSNRIAPNEDHPSEEPKIGS
jgi:formate dehydrogenase major subunit